MSGDFDCLSHWPWYSLDKVTWEVTPITDLMQSVKWEVNQFVSPNFDRGIIDLTRQITSRLWEQVVCKILDWRRARVANNRWYDVVLPWWTKVEVKTWRIWNVTVIRNTQLDFMDKTWYFSFVFYRTRWNIAPTHFLMMKNWLPPETNLKRNITIETVVILPHPAVVYYYNTSKLKEREIWKSWAKYKPLWLTNAIWIYDENHWEFNKYSSEMQIWKHKVKVYSLWLELE